MAKLSSKLRDWSWHGAKGLLFFCPGCGCAHNVKVAGENSWGWNQSIEAPTFTPSVLVTYDAKPEASEEFKEWRTARVCHSFVTDGMIQFLGDCTHHLAGQTIPLADFPDNYGGGED